MSSPTIQQKEKTAQFAWTGFIIAFFVIQAILWITAISFTSRDTSHAVVAGYDEHALNWDEIQSSKRASDGLGWVTDLAIGSDADVKGNRKVTLSLTDSLGNPIVNATVEMEAFHLGRAADVQQLRFTETSQGVYSSSVRIRHGGKWEFAGKATANDDDFLISERSIINVERRR